MHQDFEKEAKGNSEMVYSLKFTVPKYLANDTKITAKYEPIRIHSNLHGIYFLRTRIPFFKKNSMRAYKTPPILLLFLTGGKKMALE